MSCNISLNTDLKIECSSTIRDTVQKVLIDTDGIVYDEYKNIIGVIKKEELLKLIENDKKQRKWTPF